MLACGPVRLLVCMFGVATAFYIGTGTGARESEANSRRQEQAERPRWKIHKGPPAVRWWFPNQKSCVLYLGPDGVTPDEGLYCDAVWDGVLCWPVTEANSMVYQNCPPLRGLDTRLYAFRECGPDGKWLGRQDRPYSASEVGWTNYTMCYTPEAYAIYRNVFES